MLYVSGGLGFEPLFKDYNRLRRFLGGDRTDEIIGEVKVQEIADKAKRESKSDVFGKSVLVTSHTKKALAVLKEKLPDEIKDLCVSVLDDTNLDMVRSIDGITEYMFRHKRRQIFSCRGCRIC